MIKKFRKVTREELVLEEWLPPLGTYNLTDEAGTSLDCMALRFSLKKGKTRGTPEVGLHEKGTHGLI